MEAVIKVTGREGRNLTPRGDEDYLGFERAVAALLDGEKLHLQASVHGNELPGVHASVRVVTEPNPEPETNGTGAVVTLDGLHNATWFEAHSMEEVLQLATRLADALDR